MLMGMILGREAVRLRSMVNLQSHSPVFAQNPGEFIRAIHYKYWFKLPVAFGEMLIDYAKNIKVFPRIGFFSFMPSVSFFGKCMKQLKLEALVFDCLSPAYIDTVMGELSLTELRKLKIVNLDNETLDSTFTLTAKTLKKLESITVSFSQSFSDATLINIAKFTTGLKNISIDFAPGLTLQGFSTFWEELPQTVTRIVLEHVNLFSSTNKPVVLQRIQKNISELQIVRTSLPVEQLRQLALLVPNVTKLRLCDATVDDSVVQIFSRTCNKVEILCLNSSSSVTNSSLISIALHLKNLKVLSLDYLNLLTDGGVANFLGSDVGNRISSLSLYSCLGLSNSIVASICDEMNGKCLTALNLGAVNLITETGVIELLEAKGKLLSKISISGIDVGIKVLESLSQYCSKRLQVLDVGKQKWIDRTSAEMLVKRLCGLRILYAEGFMDLTENDIWEGHSFCTENGSFCRLDSLGRLDLSGFSRAAKV
ncbi:hypothetical protein BDR26DRAFT_850008 [Obelidium mucronatum]|nr:hypothetical protein BDR26DRAFT_850008 [Obelidium mucronatum]